MSKFLFQILVFVAPTQLTYHFWPNWAYVYGIRVDYLAPVVYLTDIIVISLLISWLAEKINNKLQISKSELVFGALSTVFVCLNIFYAQERGVALFKWIKILEMTLLAFYVRSKWHSLKKIISTPLALAVVYSSLIALTQFFIQRTVGGVFYFLGERSFDTGTPGIALINFFGRSLMRPYSIFPHPNVLAGFILVSLILLLPSFKNSFLTKVAYGLGIISVIISFSRLTWISAVFIVFLYIFKKRLSVNKASHFILVLMVFLSMVFGFLGCSTLSCTGLPETIFRRMSLGESAALIFSINPIFGIGLGNFVLGLNQSFTTWYLQPVHNIFLLVLAETGLIGLVVFYFVLDSAFKNLGKLKENYLTFCLLAICFLGVGDHYWLTLQQTLLLFAIVIGASFSKMVKTRWRN